MKRLISLLVVLALCLGMLPAAFAAGFTVTCTGWTEAQSEASRLGLNGEFVTLPSVGLKVWLPDGLKSFALTQDMVEKMGYIAYYMNADQTNALGVTKILFDDPDPTAESIAAAIRDGGVSQISEVTINSLNCLTYSYEVGEGFICNVVTVILPSGCAAEFAFICGDSSFSQTAACIIGSIQSAE